MNAVTGRRTFLKLSGAGLALGFYLAVPKLGQAATPNAFTPNALIRITPDGKILILAKTPEIGQGIKTAFPMIIAEELDADWADVVVEQAAINPKLYGSQSAFGSTAVADTFDILRKAGATARAMLTSAAAQTWKVPESECATGKSAVTHTPSGRVLKYAALTEKAAMLPVPDTAPFKARADYKILGTRIGGVDNKKIVTGEPLFGIDTVRPGMVFAIYEKCPNAGGKPTAFNEAEIKKLPGVLDAFMVEGNGRAIELQPGVAIVATSTYYAFEAKKQLKISWEGGATDDSDTHRAQAREMVKNAPAEMLRSEGDLDAAINTAAKVIDEYYEYPFITHATLEPQNCTAHFTGNAIEIWAPSQGCDRIAAQLAPYLGLAAEQITVHHTRVGGGFGRRLNNDYVFEVAAITKRIGKPVKLTWTREDDFAHDHYRAAGYHRYRAALDAKGKLVGWENRFITYTTNGKNPAKGAEIFHPPVANPIQPADHFPAELVANVRVGQTFIPLVTPTGDFRSPRANAQGFTLQSFLHEAAVAAGRDHVEFLLEILGEPRLLHPGQTRTLHTGRAAAVIQRAAKEAGWGRKLPPGRALGLAFYFAHRTHVAEVAEVSVDANKKITVHKVTVALDLGQVINKSTAIHMCEGAVIDGFGIMAGLEVTFKKRARAAGQLRRLPAAPHPPGSAGGSALRRVRQRAFRIRRARPAASGPRHLQRHLHRDRPPHQTAAHQQGWLYDLAARGPSSPRHPGIYFQNNWYQVQLFSRPNEPAPASTRASLYRANSPASRRRFGR